VELPKFNKTLAELTDIKDKWIYFVKNAENMKMIPTELQEPKELKEAFEVANQMTWTKKELDAYDARGIYIQDERGRIDYALEEGKEIGEKIGLQKGEKIGFDRGKFEEKQAIARAMLKEGMTLDVIARLTGLAIDEI
jgi:predicted transposase/invertase (TIGR01784 family)